MRASCFYSLLLLALASPLNCQRGGRADGAERYARGVPESELELNVAQTHRKMHFHTSDLERMKRSTLDALDPRTKQTNEYGGVRLSDLLSRTGPRPVEKIKVSFGFFHSRVIRNESSDPLVCLVADSLNGKRLKTNTFFFVAQSQEGVTVLIKQVTEIMIE